MLSLGPSLWRLDIQIFASQLLAFSPGKEQAAGVWETCLAPGWPHFNRTVVLEKTLESPFDSKEIKPFIPKGYQP